MPVSRERLLESARVWIESMREFSPEAVLSNRTDDCITYLAPRTVGGKRIDNDRYREGFTWMSGQLKNFQLDFVDGEAPIVDEVNRKVVLHMKSHAESISGPYENEYIFILTFNEDGTLLKGLIEFVDSASFSRWMEAARKAQ
ncbi:hypothetical protein HFD88_007220 [Aspergillus terreus]|nr:hypothetical protein HFD88_007220 [Aspergillus terreus]